MAWNQYQEELKKHPRYQEVEAPREARPLVWWKRRPIALAMANVGLLVATLALDWGMSGVLWAFWGEAIGVTVWMLLRNFQSRIIPALASLALLSLYFTQLLGLAAKEARMLGDLPLDGFIAAGIAGAVGIAIMMPAQVLPPVAKRLLPWPQLVLLHGAILAGGLLAYLDAPKVSYAILLLVLKAIAQSALAVVRENRRIIRVPVGASQANGRLAQPPSRKPATTLKSTGARADNRPKAAAFTPSNVDVKSARGPHPEPVPRAGEQGSAGGAGDAPSEPAPEDQAQEKGGDKVSFKRA